MQMKCARTQVSSGKTAGPRHYVSVPEGKTYVEVGAPDEGDAVTALEQFTNTLKDPSATTDEKRLALQFIVHIIGDLHQPLHAGNGTDRGGNDVKVRFSGKTQFTSRMGLTNVRATRSILHRVDSPTNA